MLELAVADACSDGMMVRIEELDGVLKSFKYSGRGLENLIV
jgi:hypothetical protein